MTDDMISNVPFAEEKRTGVDGPCAECRGGTIFFWASLTGDAIRHPGKYVRLVFRAGDKRVQGQEWS